MVKLREDARVAFDEHRYRQADHLFGLLLRRGDRGPEIWFSGAIAAAVVGDDARATRFVEIGEELLPLCDVTPGQLTILSELGKLARKYLPTGRRHPGNRGAVTG